MPSTLLDRLQRILPLGKKVADDVVCEETEILENWKTLLRGDLVPEEDLTDAIRHNGFTVSHPRPSSRPREKFPDAFSSLPTAFTVHTPPASSSKRRHWPSAIPASLPPWHASFESIHSPSLASRPLDPPTSPPDISAQHRHAVASMLKLRADKARLTVLKKYRSMAASHSSEWFNLSSNKEADERGSRASISVEGLRRSCNDTASTSLRDMTHIARDFYFELHTPEPTSSARSASQLSLLRDIREEYLDKPSPSANDSPSGTFTLSEVKALSGKMPNSAPGPDGIQYSFWKALASRLGLLRSQGSRIPSFWSTFRDLTDDLRTHGTDRMGFKDANLSLFFKKGDPTLVANYRPISSMNTDCKMYTNLINTRLAPWAMNKLHPDQKGFVPERYITEHTRLCSEVAHMCNLTGTPGYIVSLDQAKAYDRVDTSLLIRTMKAMGLPDDLLSMIEDVLDNCRTRVRINGGYSGFFSLRRGVRQGDPLSCLLYNFSIEPMGMRL